jgi:gp45 sliding clamp, C terminal
MKIGSDTLNVLKNFASINSNIVVKPGNVLRTLSPSRNIFAEAEVAETFDREFGIYDLNKFLATVSLFKDPDFDFQEKHVTIHSASSNASINYFYSETSLLTTPPKNFNMPPHQVEFTLNTRDFSELLRASAVLQAPDLAVVSTGSDIVLRVNDKRDDTSHQYSVRVADNDKNLDFCAFMKTENLKFIAGDYRVCVSNKNISEFSNTTGNVRYWISLELDSVWN